jgi:hypothetical protein
MTEYFLHTGLHKTGTKFFQHKVFPNFRQNELEYNPAGLSQYICDLMKADEEDLDAVYEAIAKEKKQLSVAGIKKVLISREVMSGDLFSFYCGYKDRYSRLHTAFPEATIICSLRYQVDWIVSCYRETIHEHHYQSIGQFLGLEKGNEKFVKANINDLDFTGIVEHLLDMFGGNKVKFFFYEDFKRDKDTMVSKISKILKLEVPKITDNGDSIPNRGYSAFSIRLSVLRFQIFRALHLDRRFIHRPISFFGPNSIPAGFEDLSVLPHQKYWHMGFMRDNEEVRSKNYPDNLTIWEKIILRFSWRNIIKNGLDKVFYWDWDLIHSCRSELDLYYKERNRILFDRFNVELGGIPENYYM